MSGMTIKNRAGKVFFQISSVEWLVILVSLVFGSLYCLTIPVMAGSDEDQHLLRVWEMSTFHFIPNEELAAGRIPFPLIYNRMSLHAQPYGAPVPSDFWSKYSRLPLDAYDYVYGSLTTRSTDAPLLLLPQALVMRYLGRRFQLPALTVFYGCRLIGLLSYALLAWLAVRLIPFGKWTLAILVLSPMAMFQASVITHDAISNGIDFLFIGGTLALAYREKIRWKEWGLLAGLFFLLFMAKLNSVFLGLIPFLFLSPARFKMKGGYWLLAGTAVLLFMVEVVGWNLLVDTHTQQAAPAGVNLIGQLRFVLIHPLQFLEALGLNLWGSAGPYLRQWLGVYGYGGYWVVPSAVYAFLAFSLGATFWLKTEGETPDRKLRLGLLAVFVLSFLATFGAEYLDFTPVGSSDILGVQGRYLIPVMPLLLLACAGWLQTRRMRLIASLTAASLVIGLAIFAAGFFLSYDVPCGTKDYSAGICYQPLYKYWNPDSSYSPPVSGGPGLVQKFQPICNGMTEIQVWVNASGTNGEEKTDFRLQESGSGTVLVERSVANATLPEGAWYLLKFDPEWKSAGKPFTLTIHADPPSDAGPRFAYYGQYETDTPGSLSVNGQPSRTNLIYQYGCITGLEKILWSFDHSVQ